MKKKIFAAALAVVATMSLSTAAFAADAGGSGSSTAEGVKKNGSIELVSEGVTVKSDKDTKLAKGDYELEADFAASEDDNKKLWKNADVDGVQKKLDKWGAEITGKLEGSKAAKVEVKAVIELDMYKDGEAYNKFGGDITVEVGTDYNGMYALYINKDKAEFYEISKGAFKTGHFSYYYIVDLADGVADQIVTGDKGMSLKNAGALATSSDTAASGTSGATSGTSGATGDNANPNTGIALAIAPAGLAVAFVSVAAVMSKKKRG